MSNKREASGLEKLDGFQPWTSDKEPQVPEGWGLDAVRWRITNCDQCGEELKRGDEYMYKFIYSGTVILHNTKECYASFIG